MRFVTLTLLVVFSVAVVLSSTFCVISVGKDLKKNSYEKTEEILGLKDPVLRSKLMNSIEDICEWILTFDMKSGRLRKGDYTNSSIYVSGNFARALMGAYSLTGNSKYLNAALDWCDYFIKQQRITTSLQGNSVGYWLTHGSTGNIYLGDTGTAVTALATACRFVEGERKEQYLKALELYARFVIEGCKEDPCGEGRGNSPGWIIRVGRDAGAIGCGYYKGHVSRLPYITATATTGGGFFSILYSLTGNEEYKEIAVNAVQWIFKVRKPSGEIPYILDNGIKDYWPYTTMTYCVEAVVGTYWRIEDREIRELIRREAKPCVAWLVKTQNEDGTWGKERADKRRSPEIISLLVWYYNEVEEDQEVLSAILQYCGNILDQKKADAFEIKRSTRTTGFAALGIEELVEPGSTFLVRKPNQKK